MTKAAPEERGATASARNRKSHSSDGTGKRPPQDGLRPIGETVKPIMLRLASIKRALDAD